MPDRLAILIVVVLAALSNPSPALADELTVAWISRLPELEYVQGSTNPRVDGWPAVGSPVIWRAHVRSWMSPAREVEYRWTLNGVLLRRGRVAIAPNGITQVDLPLDWSFERRLLKFEIDSAGELVEESESNNALTVVTDGLAVGFWVEQSVYDFFRTNQHKLGIGSTSWENWAQRLVTTWNEMSALAVYPETPDGVLDRWRIQKIVIVPDGALPLSGLPADATPGAGGATHPDQNDRTVDLMWGFRAASLAGYRNLTSATPSNPFYVAGAILHELGHARYLADVYAWDVRHNPPGFVIDIKENGVPITETLLNRPFAFRTPEQGLMNTHHTFIDRYSAIALNQISGHRAVDGNYNEPRNFAAFLNDFPAENRITVRDSSGTPIPNADVWIYQSVGREPVWYSTYYDDVPDLKLRTDASGRVLVGRSPFALDGRVVQGFGSTNGVAIVRVASGGNVAYGFLESRTFNLAWWRGDRLFADHDLVVGGSLCSKNGPVILSPRWDARSDRSVELQWEPVRGATRYRVMTSTNLGRPTLAAETTATSHVLAASGTIHWWVEADVEGCGVRRSETMRFTAPPTRTRAVRR